MIVVVCWYICGVTKCGIMVLELSYLLVSLVCGERLLEQGLTFVAVSLHCVVVTVIPCTKVIRSVVVVRCRVLWCSNGVAPKVSPCSVPCWALCCTGVCVCHTLSTSLTLCYRYKFPLNLCKDCVNILMALTLWSCHETIIIVTNICR